MEKRDFYAQCAQDLEFNSMYGLGGSHEMCVAEVELWQSPEYQLLASAIEISSARVTERFGNGQVRGRFAVRGWVGNAEFEYTAPIYEAYIQDVTGLGGDAQESAWIAQVGDRDTIPENILLSVVVSLFRDADTYRMCDSVQEFCSEFGYEMEQGMEVFKKCREVYDAIDDVLGFPEEWDTLQDLTGDL